MTLGPACAAGSKSQTEIGKVVGLFTKIQTYWRSRKKKVPRTNLEKRFELLNRTGQGSMSKVWRARDREVGRIVCLKVLDREKTMKFLMRFRGRNKPDEGAILMALRHRNVVRTLDHGVTTKDEQFVVMEFIEGMGLNFLVETKHPNLEKHRVDYLMQLADAIEYTHQQKYLHRDICPRNVMINQEGVVKLIDFGLTLPYTPAFCAPGNRTGTPNYLAPEIIRRRHTDHRVDLFALGVTAYELFTGALPWDKTTSLDTIQSHVNQPGTDPRVYRPDLDERTAQFLKKAIEREPRDRFQTAAEFKEALKALQKPAPASK